MRIGIDYRLANCSHRGMARYCREIVKKLLVLDNDNKYLLFIDSISNDSFVDYDNVEYVKINTSNFIVGEQIIIPFLLYRKNVMFSGVHIIPFLLFYLHLLDLLLLFMMLFSFIRYLIK